MLWVTVLCLASLCVAARTQPLFCKEDAQCSEGSYCDKDAHICQDCLSCQDLKREPPLAFSTCIKSVGECGACNEGLVEDGRGNLNTECVPPYTSQPATPYYVWLLIGVGVLLFLALVVGIIAYLLRNPEIFKTAGSSPSRTLTAHITTAASAPEAPPPYNPLPQSVPPYSEVEPAYNEEEQFIKRPLSPRPQDARESADNQAARVYNKPIYEREPRSPSPESPLPEYNDTMTLQIHDEDTMPSGWVPSGPTTTPNGDVNAKLDAVCSVPSDKDDSPVVSLPALLSAARDTTLVEHSAAKKRCVRQDSNKNRNRESGSCSDGSQKSFPRSPSPSQGAPPYNIMQINVVQINNSK